MIWFPLSPPRSSVHLTSSTPFLLLRSSRSPEKDHIKFPNTRKRPSNSNQITIGNIYYDYQPQLPFRRKWSPPPHPHPGHLKGKSHKGYSNLQRLESQGVWSKTLPTSLAVFIFFFVRDVEKWRTPPPPKNAMIIQHFRDKRQKKKLKNRKCLMVNIQYLMQLRVKIDNPLNLQSHLLIQLRKHYNPYNLPVLYQ